MPDEVYEMLDAFGEGNASKGLRELYEYGREHMLAVVASRKRRKRK